MVEADKIMENELLAPLAGQRVPRRFIPNWLFLPLEERTMFSTKMERRFNRLFS